ncbi:MAG: hypothetical protein JSU04_03790 [Bdellovibrionales bacterium]|nr:hypothetical protein [Bdellovibrionales bacterium]
MSKFTCVLFLAVLLKLNFSLALDPKDIDPKELDKMIKKSEQIVASGHAFYRSLACPDGSTPEFAGVGTNYGKNGEIIDSYRIRCKDGTKGNYEWAEGQTTPPNPPPGFRFKTASELKRFSPRGRVNELSVSPTGTVWITTAAGYSYFINKFEDNWVPGSLLATKDKYASDLERISFFNTKIAIATGGLNGKIYHTEDGGITWKESKPTHDQWVYSVYFTPDGKVWMGGSAGLITYSEDFGKTWKQLKTSFNTDHRLASIFMSNDKAGIAGSLDGNDLRTTLDNWETSKSIATPKSQNLTEKNARDTLKKISEFNGEFIVKQSDLVFHTKKANIKWSGFKDLKILDFSIDTEAKKIYLIDSSGYVYTSSDLNNFSKVGTERVQVPVIDSKFSAGYFHVLDADTVIYKIGNGKFEKRAPLFY